MSKPREEQTAGQCQGSVALQTIKQDIVNAADCGWHKWFITRRCSDFLLTRHL